MTASLAIGRALALAAAVATGGAAAQGVKTEHAVALVKKSVAYIKSNGRDMTVAEINNTQGQFRNRDLYLTINKLDGFVLADAADQKMVGLAMLDLKDVDEKLYMRERLEMAKTRRSFWQEFKSINPANRKVEPMKMYCERAEELVICGGIYTPA
jgi:cytochrome c